MAQIIWLASYPKSGNTWLRFLLANLLYKRIENSGELGFLIPDIHRGINARHLLEGRTTFIKTHWEYHDKLPLREDSIAAIYLVRHPLQVIVSDLNYALMMKSAKKYFAASQTEQERMRAEFVRQYLEDGGLSHRLPFGMGSWEQNVESWLDPKVMFPTCRLRYEDLSSDTPRVLREICAFLKIDKSDAEIAAAVEASSFTKLRDMEEQEIAAQQRGVFTNEKYAAAHAAGRRFMNAGRIDSYKEILSAAQIGAAAERFSKIMDRLGYVA